MALIDPLGDEGTSLREAAESAASWGPHLGYAVFGTATIVAHERPCAEMLAFGPTREFPFWDNSGWGTLSLEPAPPHPFVLMGSVAGAIEVLETVVAPLDAANIIPGRSPVSRRTGGLRLRRRPADRVDVAGSTSLMTLRYPGTCAACDTGTSVRSVPVPVRLDVGGVPTGCLRMVFIRARWVAMTC